MRGEACEKSGQILAEILKKAGSQSGQNHLKQPLAGQYWPQYSEPGYNCIICMHHRNTPATVTVIFYFTELYGNFKLITVR